MWLQSVLLGCKEKDTGLTQIETTIIETPVGTQS